MNDRSNNDSLAATITCKIRKSIYNLENPPQSPADPSFDKCYKEKLEKEIKEWEQILEEKYLCTKNPPPQLKESSEEDATNVKLTDEQEIYLSQAPDFQQMIADRKEFVKTVDYYLQLRSHVADGIEYRHNLLNSVTNKAVRDIINKAIYE